MTAGRCVHRETAGKPTSPITRANRIAGSAKSKAEDIAAIRTKHVAIRRALLQLSNREKVLLRITLEYQAVTSAVWFHRHGRVPNRVAVNLAAFSSASEGSMLRFAPPAIRALRALHHFGIEFPHCQK